MKRNSPSVLSPGPLLLWADLARKTMEMLFASAYVIGHRTGRMAKAGPRPNARDQREFALMSQEKIDAAVASATAMSTHWMRANLLFGTQLAEQMWKTGSALMALSASRSSSQVLARQATLARALSKTSQSTTAMITSTARLMQHGLKPIHARATANSRRLRKL